ncbi:MAG: DUF1735 and LamG domain-containing protein [Chitinophagaceae bacterium]|nr:DUF1735 and LamG domain-containing protein [Chitinophagaceae bacterium]
MKIKNISLLFLLLAALATGCKKAAEHRKVVYFTDTEQYPEKTITIDNPFDLGISVTSSIKVNQDIPVSIQLDPQLIDHYNAFNGTTYKPLPNGSYELRSDGGKVVIKGGTNRSESATFAITSLANFEEGAIYLMPISITSVNGGLEVLESSRTIYIIIKQTIITQAASLASNRYFSVPNIITDPSLANIPQLTMECRVRVNAFQTANPFISSLMGIEENYLLRFGDVSVANNQMQLAGGTVGGSKHPVTSNTRFATNEWVHVAVVYNGSTNSLYVNGVLDNYADTKGGNVDLTSFYQEGFLIGRSANGRYLNGAISEARIWTRALTPVELQANMCYVSPTTPGLLAYWRFNGDITGNEVADLTGHGYTAIANNTITWIPGVRCPE